MRYLPFLLLSLLACQPTPPAKTASLPLRPHILWITTEDMSPRLASYGDAVAHTPHLDRLAAQGVRYTRAFSVSGVCAPSRAALITGMYPTTIGAQHMRTMKRTSALADITDPELLAIPTYEAVPPSEVRCFPERLRAAGYYCTNNAKEDYQFTRPVTAWDESSQKAHWRNRRPGQPFFAVFNIGITHESQVWARAEEPWVVDTSQVVVPPYYPNTPIVRRDLARHYNNIQLMDARVGEILGELEADGLLDSTVIFFFGDHGDGLPRAKRWCYDSGLQVPLLIRWPDALRAGTVDSSLVSFVDFAPSVLSGGWRAHPRLDAGPGLFGAAAGRHPRSYIYAARDRMDPAIDNVRAVRDRRFKYLRNYMPERPYVQFLPYRDRMGLMQELLRLHEAGQLEGPQKLWFRETKPRRSSSTASPTPMRSTTSRAIPAMPTSSPSCAPPTNAGPGKPTIGASSPNPSSSGGCGRRMASSL
jgi:N-sulfoglucosamine sulfohydrolase